MTTETRNVFEAALSLPENERELLVECLIESLSAVEDELSDDELATELERRRTEIEQGIVNPIPWSEIRLG